MPSGSDRHITTRTRSSLFVLALLAGLAPTGASAANAAPVATVATVATGAAALPAPGAVVTPADASTDEQLFHSLLDEARAAQGLGPLQYDPGLATVAADWAATMAGTGVLAHNPDLVVDIDAAVGPDWTYYGGNVGVGYDVVGLHQAFLASPTHAANVYGPYNRVGVGIAWSASTMWVSIVFLGGPPLA